MTAPEASGGVARVWRHPALMQWLLLPHLLAVVACVFGIAIVLKFNTNRLIIGQMIGVLGLSGLVAAPVASVLAAIRLVGRAAPRPRWPWVLAHLMALPLVAVAGFVWMAFHLV